MNTAQQVAESLGQSLYRTLQTAEEYAPLSGKSRALMEFTAMMDGIAESVDEVPLIETLEQVLDQSGYVRALEAKNDMESRGPAGEHRRAQDHHPEVHGGDRGAQPFRLFGGDRPLHRSG